MTSGVFLLTVRRPDFSLPWSLLSPVRFPGFLTTRLRWASNSDSLRFSIIDRWSRICLWANQWKHSNLASQTGLRDLKYLSRELNCCACVCVTLTPVSLHSVCNRVLSVLCGTSLFSCLSFSLGKTFIKLWTSRRIRSRLMLSIAVGRKRIILHRHWTCKHRTVSCRYMI